LIALDRIGQLELLPSLFVVHAPQGVAEEFGRIPAWLHVRPVELTALLEELLLKLDQGEAEAIVLAHTMAGARLLLDERRGRAVAQSLGLPVTGTAGILLAAKAVGLLTEIRPLLDALIHEHDFRLSERHYAQVLSEAGEM